MIGLSVAIGRFVEALFYAILRVAGVVALGVFTVAIALLLAWIVGRWAWRRRSKG